MNLEMVGFSILAVCAALALLSLISLVSSERYLFPATGFSLLTLVGIRDMIQNHRSIRRTYPIIGNIRFLFDTIRPEIRQYLIETADDEVPLSREARAIVYQRAKNIEDKPPFGTKLRVYEGRHQWLIHSLRPQKIIKLIFG